MLIVIGWDPGVAPAAAVYAGPEFVPSLFPPMGVTREMPSKLKRRRSAKRYDPAKPQKERKPTVKVPTETNPDVLAMLKLIDLYPDAIHVLENVHAWGGQGVVSSSRFVGAARLIEGLIIGRSRRIDLVDPDEWRAEFRLPKGKDVSRTAVVRMFPDLSGQVALAKDHNQCEALLMAIWRWRREMGTLLGEKHH